MTVKTKQCNKCKAIKMISDYTINNSKIDGLDTYCKVCRRETNRNYRKQERYKITRRLYKTSVESRNRDAVYGKSYNVRTRIHRNALSYANKKTIGKRENCWVNNCIREGTIYLIDISLPINLVWLCIEHRNMIYWLDTEKIPNLPLKNGTTIRNLNVQYHNALPVAAGRK